MYYLNYLIKSLLVLGFILLSVNLNQSLYAKVTVCWVNNRCDEISRFKIEGEWYEACCYHLAPVIANGLATSCEDDC